MIGWLKFFFKNHSARLEPKNLRLGLAQAGKILARSTPNMMRGNEPTFNFELGIVNKNSMSSNNDTADANCNEITAILFFPQARDLLRPLPTTVQWF